MTCKIKKCNSDVLGRKLCRKHYLRWWRHGHPLGKSDFVQPKGADSPCFKHGHWNHELYKTWRNMIDRCTNPKNKKWKDYGGRGISVCSRWLDIANFIEDMGRRPKGMTLDRIDNNGGYRKDNCRWATMAQQTRNRRICVLTQELADQIRKEPRRGINGRGEGQTRQDIANKYGVSLATIKKVLSNAYWS